MLVAVFDRISRDGEWPFLGGSCGSDSFPKAANGEHGGSAKVRYATAIPKGSHRPGAVTEYLLMS